MAVDPANGSPHTVEPAAFVELTTPYRAELLAHCYRMTGSLHDAEDLVQETMLRAWRGYPSFEHRASIRTWLYRIATNVCLNARTRGSRRRVLPAGLGTPSVDADGPLELGTAEIAWLEPIPDRMLTRADDPAELVVSRESIRLAFVAALQYLSPRQRAILLLRDVLDWRTGEVAELLAMSVPAVNSALLRARRAVCAARHTGFVPDDPDDPASQALLDRYVMAFERADMRILADLLHADADVQMPPYSTWLHGREAIVGFFATRIVGPGHIRTIRTEANGQPGLLTFLRTETGDYQSNSLHLVSFSGGRLRSVVAFVGDLGRDICAGFDPGPGT